MASIMLNSVTLTFLIMMLILYCIQKMIKFIQFKLPPGPRGLPCLGYLPFLGTNTYISMYRLAKKYGRIFRIKLGHRNFVVLSDPAIIQKAYNHFAFSGKPITPLYGIFKGYGVINTRGHMWREERRFLQQHFHKTGLRKYNVEKEKIENIIKVEIEHLMDNIMAKNCEPMNLDDHMTALSTNIITAFMISTRYNTNHPIFLKHKRLNGEGFELFAKLDLVNYIWILQFLPDVIRNMKKLQMNHTESMEFYREVIRERRKTYIPGKTNDVLDSYLALEYEEQMKGGSMKNFDDQVAQVLCDLVSAGGESTKTTILWALLYFIKHSDVLDKMREEINKYVEPNKLPSLTDQPNLVYCQAVIKEVMRCSNVVPIAPNHATETDFELEGFHIPKGSSVVALLYACHMDPKYWDSPDDFRPERFIENGALVTPKAFMPFGKGKRSCLGDTLAIAEIFLVVTALVQNFEFHLPVDSKKPSMEGVVGVTNRPQDYEISLMPRPDSYVLNR